MSWSIIDVCYGCTRKECTDMEKIQRAVGEIHNDPSHSDKGGAGNIVVSCYRRTTN